MSKFIRADEIEYCITCQRITNLNVTHSPGIVQWKCSKCGKLIDQLFDDECGNEAQQPSDAEGAETPR